VHKYRPRCGDLGVVVYQESEVGHSLVATVRGGLEVLRGFVGRGVDIVDAEVVAVREGGEPGCITVCVDVGCLLDGSGRG
jgi:hypothetical protein